jgi:aminoglycoside phosphotransferase (APT) family kinase protein
MMRAGPSLPNLTEDTFTPDRTRLVAEAACREVGLDATGAVLMRHQTNAVFRLVTEPVVVKVVRPGIRHTRDMVKLVQWLVGQGVPSVALLEKIRQPLQLAGCAVTLWHYLPQERAISAADIAGPLRALHELPPPPMKVPELDALGAIHHSIQVSRLLSTEERESLLRHWKRLVDLVPQLRYSAGPQLIHGDPQHRNTLWDNEYGRPVLCDWESAALGHVEWDLVTIDVHCRRFGFAEQDYVDFCQRYGRDIRDWDGYPVLRDLRELRMITTNARKSAVGSPEAVEVHRRIAALRGESNDRWVIL